MSEGSTDVEPDAAGATAVADPTDALTGDQVTDAVVEVVADAQAIPTFLMDREVDLDLPANSRTVVVSDLHLPTVATPTSTAVADEIAALLTSWEGPGAFIIAGDGFEMLAGPPDVDKILDAHPDLTAALAAFSAADHRTLVVLSGNHDGQLAWDGDAVDVLRRRVGADQFALACNLTIATDQGPQRVRVVHGNQADPYNAFEDPWSPVDTPFGHHVVRDLLPQLESRQSPGSLLEGVQWLDGDIADFMGSRLFYRKLVGKLWLLAIPFVAILLLRILTFIPGIGSLLHHHAQRWLLGFGIFVLLIVLVAVVAAVATLLRVNRALRETAVSARSDPSTHNAAARAEAARLVTQGFAGMISGHTHEPELSVVGNGFYANTGSGTSSVAARPSRLRLPHPFVTVHRFSYVEVRGSSLLELALWIREVPVKSPVLLERLAQARCKVDLSTTQQVATLPTGPTWPINESVLARWVVRRRVRKVAAAGILIPGVLNIVFAALWHIRSSQAVDRWIPLGVHPLTITEAVVAGLAFCGLAWGLRLGLRAAWIATLVALVATTSDRLFQNGSFYGSTIALVFALWLFVEHQHFRVRPSGVTRLWVRSAAVGLVLIGGTAVVGSLFNHGHRQGLQLVLIMVLVVVLLFVAISRPGAESRRTGPARQEAFDRARSIIETYGGDTLDYFALRDDKSFFFTGESLVAYSVINGVMLVSPDPIGPVGDRADVWSDVMDFAQSNNWSPTVLAASQAWLGIYRAAGLVDHYIGDEAIVDCGTFTLAGKSMKSLRGAYNRVKKEGCRVECYVSTEAIPDDIRTQLLELMTETRQGEAERGYSMTLSRIFDPRDDGLLLAVCFGADGRPMAFNQYVPASEVNGYSLDLMRRTNSPDAPNGLTDFVIIETIQWMADQGLRGLGLNFATMRAIVAGEAGSGPWTSLERSVLHHFSDTMQIESLWKFNKKYEPRWNPRYVVTGPHLPLARSGLAIARAESVAELPVIGPLLRTHEPTHSSDQA